MKRSLFGPVVLALLWSAQATAQTQVDYYDEVYGDCIPPGADDETIIICSPRLFEDHDEMVVVGTRIGYARLDDITAPVSIITQAQIEARAQSNIADVLRSVPGLAVSASGSTNGLTQLRLRGAEANQVVVLVDGVEVSNPADGGFDFAGLRADNIVRVEVLRGEQSALYGADAVAGVINIVTTAGDTSGSWRATVEAGSFDTLEGSLSTSIALPSALNEAILTISGNVFTTDGFDVSGSDGLRDEADGASGRSVRIGLREMHFGPVQITAHYASSHRNSEFDNDADFDGRLDDTDDELDVDIESLQVRTDFDLGNWETHAQFSRARTVTDTRAAFATLTTGTREQATVVMGREWDARHAFTALGEYEREEYAFAGDLDTPSNDLWGLAGDYRFTGGATTLTASARYDANGLFDDSLTWRFGAGYDTDAFGRFTASLGSAVKNPTLIELFGFFPSSNFVGNPGLRPEESLGYNIGWSITHPDGSDHRARFAINYFRSELSNEIITIFNPDFTTGVDNLDTDSTREGVELEGFYSLGDISLSASLSLLNSDQDGTAEVRRPEVLGSASVRWQASDALALSLFADHTGSQLDTDFATFSNVELDAFTLVGAKADWDIGDNYGIYLRGENLLDEDYQELVGYRSPGAAVFVGLRADY